MGSMPLHHHVWMQPEAQAKSFVSPHLAWCPGGGDGWGGRRVLVQVGRQETWGGPHRAAGCRVRRSARPACSS